MEFTCKELALARGERRSRGRSGETRALVRRKMRRSAMNRIAHVANCSATEGREAFSSIAARNWPPDGSSLRASLTIRLALFIALAASAARPAPAATVSVEAEQDASGVNIVATAVLDADTATAWRVLTDYGRYTEFVPDLRTSRVILRRGNFVMVEQSGEARLWLFRMPLDITFEVSESPPYALQSRVVAGNLRTLESRYVLAPTPTGTRLEYAGRIVPGLGIFGDIEQYAVRRSVLRQFQALADEIERVGASTARRPVPGAR
jgi:hypothetical protein